MFILPFLTRSAPWWSFLYKLSTKLSWVSDELRLLSDGFVSKGPYAVSLLVTLLSNWSKPIYCDTDSGIVIDNNLKLILSLIFSYKALLWVNTRITRDFLINLPFSNLKSNTSPSIAIECRQLREFRWKLEKWISCTHQDLFLVKKTFNQRINVILTIGIAPSILTVKK